jgi:ABC-type polysaccharide/polyol phosphate transport system, ATPase component
MNISEELAIDVREVSKCYHVYAKPSDRLKQSILPRIQHALGLPEKAYYREFWALRDVSFSVRAGESVGIIGRNGSGKSTLLQLICGTLAPTGGHMATRGRVAALLELGSGFNPEFTGRENIYMNGAVLGLTEEEMSARYERIVEFSEISEFIDQPVKTYSSGMFMRLAFAVQAHIDASVVIIDEALTVGDVFFRQKCYARLDELRASGAAILLVSHSMPDIEQYCERAVLLDRGVVRFIGSSSEAARHYYLVNQERSGPPAHSAATNLEVEPTNDEKEESIGCPRPQAGAFLDISTKSQVGDGRARCMGVALMDIEGRARNNFKQGERAIIYSEYAVSEEIGIPISGLVISSDRGTIVHGKNSWQCDLADEVEVAKGGTSIHSWQEVTLDLAPGDYVYEIGLSCVSEPEWRHRNAMSYDQINAAEVRVCHMVNVGSFSIGLATRDGVTLLTHHGLANLPGSMRLQNSHGRSGVLLPWQGETG